MNLGISDLGVVDHKGVMLLPGVPSRVALNLKLKLPFSQIGFLMLLNQWTKKGAIVLAVGNNTNILEKLNYYQIMGLEGICVEWRWLPGGLLRTSRTNDKRQLKTTTLFRQDC